MCFCSSKKNMASELIDYLKKNINSTIGTYSLSNSKFYKNKYNKCQTNSLYLFSNSIALPCHENINFDKIIREINNFFAKN